MQLIQCLSRDQQKAKFRSSLKASVLLHDDIDHLSLAPVHEMLGVVERSLGQWERSRLHLMAAAEICEKGLTRVERTKREGGDAAGGDAACGGELLLEGMERVRGAATGGALTEQEVLRINIGRIKRTLTAVEAEKEAAAEAGGGRVVGAAMAIPDQRRRSREALRKRRKERKREAATDDGAERADQPEEDEDGAYGDLRRPRGFGGHRGLGSIHEESFVQQLSPAMEEEEEEEEEENDALEEQRRFLTETTIAQTCCSQCCRWCLVP